MCHRKALNQSVLLVVLADTSRMASHTAALGHVQVLIIDEISMISAEMFHQLEHHARMIRGMQQPFGGVQLVLSGDYFQ